MQNDSGRVIPGLNLLHACFVGMILAVRKTAPKGRSMSNKNPRGLFERPPGSGVWWINYYAAGKQHREKVGRKSDAIKLYQVRKADATAGRKLPELRNSSVVKFAELMADAVEFAKLHNRTSRDYVSKQLILLEPFGARPAADITPQELDRWLHTNCKTAATSNRYKSFVSLCYREGISNGKVTVNPARLVRQRKENNARLRFLTRDEYDSLSAAILERAPEHHAAFVVSVYTGMRLGEQYSLRWSQVHLDRKTIELTMTKNGYDRTVQLNSVALTAMEVQRAAYPKAKANDFVFPRPGPSSDYRWWFDPALKDAGIEGYTWHSNRHTFCSWLAMAGASIKDIQELAGHKTITMSARYSHLSPAHALTASERLVSAVPAQ